MKVQYLESCEECGNLKSARPVIGITKYNCFKMLNVDGIFREIPDPAVIPEWCPLPDKEE